METAYLHEFAKVAECGSFTAAARELHLTQSTLSKHVALLEREFGADLFVRDRSGVSLTEAGGVLRGAIKSSVGMGVLLSEGIGDTLRVSLTAAPEEEMTVAWELLRALGLRQRGPEIISCPTCGRTEIDLIGLAQEVERRLRTEKAPIKVAVMGCVVNGPGEAREADLGMAGGRDKGIIFRKGEVIRSVRGQEALLAAFMEELDKLLVERRDL